MKRLEATQLRFALVVLVLGTSAWAMPGCAPEFSDDQCQSDQDCFPDEVCNTSGFCQLEPEFDAGPDAFDGSDGGDVSLPTVARIELSPSSAEIGLGMTTQLEATAYDADDNAIDTALLEWSSSDETVATVDTVGEVTGVALGSAQITVTSVAEPDVSATADITVVEGDVERIELSPDPGTVTVGETLTFAVTAYNAADREIGTPNVNWSVDDTAIATIGTDGVATGVAPGTAQVSAKLADDASITATASLEVTPVPVARVEVTSPLTSIEVGATVQLTATAYDADDNELTGRDATWSSDDDTIASVDADGLVTGEDVGTATITAEVEGHTATINIEVVVGNVPPTAQPDTATVVPAGTVTIDVLANDSDPDTGDTLSIVAVDSSASSGGATINGTSVDYTAANTAGTDTFTYTVSDGNGGSAVGTVTVTVNTPPVAQDDAATATYGSTVSIDVLANDSDADSGDTLSIDSLDTTGTNGTVSIASGSIDYTAPASGSSDSFSYTLSDTRGATATATVTVALNAPNSPPVAADDTATAAPGATVSIDVLANDSDPDTGDTLQIDSVDTSGANGTAVINGTSIDYTAPGAAGTDTFSYTVSDGNGGTDTATVTVTINTAPVAQDDTATATLSQTVSIDVLANDSDADTGDTLSIDSVDTTSTAGSAVINAGAIDYTAPASGSSDTFSYTISDTNGATATATVTVTLEAPNTPPVAADDTATAEPGATITIDVLTNDNDADSGDTLSIDSVDTSGASGTASINGTSIDYTAPSTAGTDTFSYTVSDGNGGTDTATVTVTINTPPVAQDDAVSVAAGATVTVDVLANDSDADTGDTLSLDSVDTSGTAGTATINGSSVDYTAPASGTSDSFTYTISDTNGATATATVNVTIQ